MNWQELVPILQIAVGPVILISGVGLLLLGMTNRLGRIVDRSRALVRTARELDPEERSLSIAQLRILDRRARLVRAAIALACLSALAAAVLVVTLFLSALLGIGNGVLIVAIFTACLGALIASLLYFFIDIHLALGALRLETSSLLAPED